MLKYTGQDIHLQYKRMITVRRNITKGNITTPKTPKSLREVPILDDLVPYFKTLSESKSMWLFHTEEGKPLKAFAGNRQKEWKDLLRECKIEYRKIYSTRHTFIVSMLK